MSSLFWHQCNLLKKHKGGMREERGFHSAVRDDRSDRCVHTARDAARMTYAVKWLVQLTWWFVVFMTGDAVAAAVVKPEIYRAIYEDIFYTSQYVLIVRYRRTVTSLYILLQKCTSR
jgi:hypothetical protein